MLNLLTLSRKDLEHNYAVCRIYLSLCSERLWSSDNVIILPRTYATVPKKLQAKNEVKQRRSAELDSEIADKEEHARKVDRENTDSIKSGIANLFGKGKYAAIEQGNIKLKAENEHIKKIFQMSSGKR